MEVWLIVIGVVAAVMLAYPMEILVERVPGRESLSAPWLVCAQCSTGSNNSWTLTPIGIVYHLSKCKHCSAPHAYPFRPLVIAVVSAVVFAGSAVRFGAHADLIAYDVLAVGLIVLSVIDLERMILPVVAFYPTLLSFAILLAISSLLEGRLSHLWVAMAAGVVCFLIFLVIHIIVPQGMGFGDVRLAGLLGLATGWISAQVVLVGFVLAFGLGAFIGILLMLLKNYGSKSRLPFAPFLVAGTFLALMWGLPIARVWLHSHY